MLVATLYKFAKKDNSTALPTGTTPSLAIQIIINDGSSSILSPSIRVPTNQSGVPQGSRIFDYNYIYIPDFRRYYYTSNWVYNADGTWSALCTVDALASWKDEIIASPGYVGRAESPHVDVFVQDRFYISRNTPVTIRDNADTNFSAVPSMGTVILGVTSAASRISEGAIGAVQYYALSMADFRALSQSLLGIYNGNNFTIQDWKNTTDAEFKADAWQSLNNPIQYVSSCRFYPFPLVDFNLAHTQIVMGGWNAGGNGGILLNRLYQALPIDWSTKQAYSGEINISDVNQVGQYDPEDYPTYAPYASYLLQSPWGEFELDANIMSTIHRRQTPKLYWQIMLNISNGMGTFVVMDTSGAFPEMSARTTRHELLRTDIKFGSDLALLATYTDDKYQINVGKGVASSLIGMMGGAFSAVGGNLGGGITQGAQSFADLAFGVADACIGGEKSAQGNAFSDVNCSPMITQITVQQTRYSTVGQAPGMFGKPYKRAVANLNGFSGFVQMDYSQFNAECTDTERTTIIDLLRGGVLIE